MKHWVIDNEALIRLSFFTGMFFIVAVWELLAPRRQLQFSKSRRWYSNIGIVIVNSLVIRWGVSLLPVSLALLAQDRSWGLFNNIASPDAVRTIVSFLILDCIIYLQHIMFHAVPLLWRLHRMHHTDLDYDVTTGTRFHPLEIIISLGIKLGIIAVIGPSAIVVVIFEVVLNLTAMFNHGNIFIPSGIDKILRGLVVTPDMHRVHHSINPKETNSNFGFNFPWWDRLFGTYRAQPEKGHLEMTIGLNQFRDPQNLHLHQMLIQPFIGTTDDYPINQ